MYGYDYDEDVYVPEVMGYSAAPSIFGGYSPAEPNIYGWDDPEMLDEEETAIEVMGQDNGVPEELIDQAIGKKRRRKGKGRPVKRRQRRGPGGRRGRPGLPSPRQQGMHAMAQRRMAERAAVAPHPPMMPFVQGAPPVAEKGLPLPFDTHTATVAAQGAFILTAQPQAQLQGARLVTKEVPNANAVTDGASLVINDIKVGTRSEFAGSGAIPFDTFARDSQDVMLSLDGAGPGILITLHCSVLGTLATAGAEIAAAATLLGPAIN